MGLSSVTFGFSLASTGTAFEILKHQEKWSDDLVATLSICGIAFGSIIGGSIVKYGQRMTVIIFNVVIMIGSVLSLFKIFSLICIGRFIHGFSSGVLVSAVPKIIDETVPSHIVDKWFGTSTNLMINVGIMTNMLLGIGTPVNE